MEIRCNCCNKVIQPNEIVVDESDNPICRDCATTKYIQCVECGRLIPRSEQRKMCDVCDSGYYNNVQNSYTTKPAPRFKGKYSNNNTGRYYGLEIEYNYLPPATAYTLFNDMYKNKIMYNKHDGSIASGVEIVTNPMDKKTLFDWLDKMKDGLSYIKKTIKGTSRNAGIHIHVNRKSISSFDIYKLSYLLNYSTTMNESRIIYYISGRLNKYSDSKYYESFARVGTVSDKEQIYNQPNRYQAVNLLNSSTVEFRIFKSTTSTKRIKSYINFVDDLIEYVSNNGLSKMNISSFIAWEVKNTKDKYIKDRITTFLKYNTLVDPRDNKYKINIERFKGIKVEKYPELIDRLKTMSSLRDMDEIIESVKHGRGSYTEVKNRRFNISIVNTLERTLRLVLINKIMKGKEKCA